MQDFTTSELIKQIKRIAHVPTSQVTYQTADFLSLLDTELQSALLPLVMSVQEGFYLKPKDLTLTFSDNTAGYELPQRAIGMKLADVQLVNGSNIQSMPYVSLDELTSTTDSPNGSASFYVAGNRVYPLPVSQTGTLRLWHYQRPSKLVATSAVAVIESINTNQVVVTSLPSTISASTPVDLVKAKPPFDVLSTDQTVSVSGTTLTFSSLPSGLTVGDYVTLAGESPVPQLPLELHPLLCHKVAARICEAQGYTEKWQKISKTIEIMEKNALLVISPRVDQEAKTIKPNRGLLWGGNRRRF